MFDLVVVESPKKAKTIAKFLGENFKVIASAGHIRDLPANEMGVHAPNFRPEYQVYEEKKKLASTLRSLSKEARMVYLATDLDREGEAIAWHLLEVMKPKTHKRMVFNEITQKALLKAVENAGQIDMAMVAAQEARRVNDRIVGYTVSPLLTEITKAPSHLSAGRVQSTALLIVVDRELAIRAFKSTDHYKLIASFPFPGKNEHWSAEWLHKPFQQSTQRPLSDIFTDLSVITELDKAIRQQPAFMVYKIESKVALRNAPPPFTTSTLQQAASNSLGMEVDDTMKRAQTLFEAGLISYHRTDSLNLSAEATDSIRSWLASNNHPIPDSPNTWSSKADAQEAHEAIRPSDTSITQPSDFPPDSPEGKLYELIWKRTVASQMLPARYNAKKILLLSAVKVADQHLQFQASGRTLFFPGWLALTPEDAVADADEVDEGGVTAGLLPDLVESSRIQCKTLELKTSVTKPPPRYTSASLVKALESHGIGRPSTYASIMATLFKRSYVLKDGRKLSASELGIGIITLMRGRFSFVALDFTRMMEAALDLIAQGQASYIGVVTYQYNLLLKEVAEIRSDPTAIEMANDRRILMFGEQVLCPICKTGELRRRGSAGSGFWGCSRYPECSVTCSDKKVRGGAPVPDLETIRLKSSNTDGAPKAEIVKS
ncbi:type I DNA topoisomerase [Pseudomonas sp. LS-2]|uniref:type I DNA topoisomerase n=1 Tax=Pseudomonas sp. LS-2 TaxID=2315859 RepID=UPI000E743575|nr:type I DNA topoisomerase [Pseudomonas sp. LS-2]RJX72612.1 type I DNA topoisomerase [Pseudomonas sp. LS-2]